MSHMIFVYGTLKSGEPNHHYLSDSIDQFCRFIGHGRTEKKYPLVIASKYNIPYLLDVIHPDAKSVVGEIYQIDENLLKKLDVLENHPDYYVRRLENIVLLNENRLISCWIYFLKNFPLTLLENPDAFLDEYSSLGDHGLVYVSSFIIHMLRMEFKWKLSSIGPNWRTFSRFKFLHFCDMATSDNHLKNLDALIFHPNLMTKDELIQQLKIRLVDEKLLINKSKEALVGMGYSIFVPKPQRAIFANHKEGDDQDLKEHQKVNDRKRKVDNQTSDRQNVGEEVKVRKLITWP